MQHADLEQFDCKSSWDPSGFSDKLEEKTDVSLIPELDRFLPVIPSLGDNCEEVLLPSDYLEFFIFSSVALSELLMLSLLLLLVP